VYGRLPSFVLGFHGCDHAFAAAVISGRKQFTPSQNDYDWLGTGIYFWENNPQRALEFVTPLLGKKRRGKRVVNKPAVIGAVIDLGLCLNLLDSTYLQVVKEGYQTLKQAVDDAGRPMPVNRPPKGGDEVLLRHLDCAVINAVHAFREEHHLPKFDTVRSAFIEGDELYPGSTFREKNHIQVCVRNTACIKGYFWPVATPDEAAAAEIIGRAL
jgi:hypothetical protein